MSVVNDVLRVGIEAYLGFNFFQWFMILFCLAVTMPFVLRHYGISFTHIEPTKETDT